MDELKLSASAAGYPVTDEITDKERIKKKRGCGCFLIGCFALVLLCALPFIGGFVYLGTLGEADYGHFVIMALENPDIAKGIKEGIQNNDNSTPEQKAALLTVYDAFLNKYETLTPDKKEAVNRNIIVVVKKAVSDPDGFAKEPPQELNDIIMTLGLGTTIPGLETAPVDKDKDDDSDDVEPDAVDTTQTAPVQTTTTTTSTTTTTTKPKDPYSFDLPDTNKQPSQDNVESSQYDF